MPDTPTAHPGWTPLGPEPVVRSTYYPAALAMGTTLIFAGLITSWIFFLAGLGLFATALTGWIAEIRHERRAR